MDDSAVRLITHSSIGFKLWNPQPFCKVSDSSLPSNPRILFRHIVAATAMRTDETRTDPARALIREWGSSAYDDVYRMESIWEIEEGSVPFTPVACNVIFKDFEDA